MYNNINLFTLEETAKLLVESRVNIQLQLDTQKQLNQVNGSVEGC